MKRLLLVAVMVLVTLVGMVGVSRAADPAMQSVITQLQNIQRQVNAISSVVSALQTTVNGTNGADSTLQTAVNSGVTTKSKMYYLTVTSFNGGGAITACDSGFHMASISEIQDPSNLQYRGKPAYDSLYDSPVYDQRWDQYPVHTGWVRTGANPLAGLVDDCDIWRSSSDERSGTMMSRGSLWGEASLPLYESESDPAAWWQSTRTASCSQPEPVWCVEDPA